MRPGLPSVGPPCLLFSSAESFFTSWLGRRKNEVSPSTHLRYGAIVQDFLGYLGPRAQDDLSAISPSDIRQFRDYQAYRMSAVSANLSVKVIRNAFKSAIRERLVAENPAAKEFIDPTERRNENQRRRAFSVPELRRLVTAAEDSEWKGLILAGLYLGQRLGDIARLRWSSRMTQLSAPTPMAVPSRGSFGARVGFRALGNPRPLPALSNFPISNV
jgi:integrase